MKKIIIILIILLFPFVSSPAEESAEKYYGTGSADIINGDKDQARQTALDLAFKDVLGQAVGILVKTESMTEDGQSIKNQIQTQAKGYIKKHKIVKESTKKNVYSIVIEAEVYEEKVESAFSSRISKFIEKNYFNGCTMSVNDTRYAAVPNYYLSISFYCMMNDPTIQHDSVNIFLPVSGEHIPKITTSGIFSSVVLEGETVSNADFINKNPGPSKLLPDVLSLLNDSRKTVTIKFRHPVSGKMTEQSVQIPFNFNIAQSDEKGKPVYYHLFQNVSWDAIPSPARTEILQHLKTFPEYRLKMIERASQAQKAKEKIDEILLSCSIRISLDNETDLIYDSGKRLFYYLHTTCQTTGTDTDVDIKTVKLHMPSGKVISPSATRTLDFLRDENNSAESSYIYQPEIPNAGFTIHLIERKLDGNIKSLVYLQDLIQIIKSGPNIKVEYSSQSGRPLKRKAHFSNFIITIRDQALEKGFLTLNGEPGKVNESQFKPFLNYIDKAD